MFFRFYVYLTLTVFLYDASFSAFAKRVQRVRESSSKDYSRKVRLTSERLNKPSANNVFRTVEEERKYKVALTKYYATRTVEEMLADFEHDYDVALKIYLRDNIGTLDPEEDLQKEINKFLRSGRQGRIVGIKNVDTEGLMHLPSQFRDIMKRYKISFSGVVKNFKGEFDLKTLLDEKNLYMDQIFPNGIGKNRSKALKKVLVDAMLKMKDLKERRLNACDGLGKLNLARLLVNFLFFLQYFCKAHQ